MNRLFKFDPFADFEELQRQLFGDNWGQATSNVALPTADVYVNEDKELIGEFHMPGFKEDEIDISVHEGALEVRAQKTQKEEQSKSKKKYVVRESSSSFYRHISLPQHADEDNVEATFENGVLRVTVPFKDLPNPKKVTIKSKERKLLKK